MTAIEVNGTTLNARTDGLEDGPWMVLSNSLGTDLHMWDPQMPLLTDSYRVLRYDTRGHGGSATPQGPYSFVDLTGDVIALMDAHSIETADFMGLSMGGMTGLGLALDHPSRIGRLVCADARADAPAPFRENWDVRIAKVRESGLEGIVEGTLATWLTPDWRSANPKGLETMRRMVLGNDPEGYIGCCQALKELDYLRRLAKIGCPTLYVCGTQDKGATPDTMRQMADATPGAQFAEVPGAAHIANVNAPEAFDRAIAGFLGL